MPTTSTTSTTPATPVMLKSAAALPSPVVVAKRAADDLAGALELAGLPRLPSLRGDVAFGERPHVELGGATVGTVAALAAWIRERAR